MPGTRPLAPLHSGIRLPGISSTSAIEGEGDRRRSSWQAEVVVELHDLSADTRDVRRLTQGRLYTALWHGDARWLEADAEDPPVPRGARELQAPLCLGHGRGNEAQLGPRPERVVAGPGRGHAHGLGVQRGRLPQRGEVGVRAEELACALAEEGAVVVETVGRLAHGGQLLGSPRTRSPRMLRWISLVPAAMVAPKLFM